MGINLGCIGEVLTNSEHVLRGLNPKHCEDGLPTEGCFIVKATDPVNDGPSYGIHLAPPDQEAVPLGVRQGITAEIFLTKLPNPSYGIARLNVGQALQNVIGSGVRFVQKDDEDWGEHRAAHSMMTGHQQLQRSTLNDLKRYLAKLASQGMLKAPVTG